MTETKQTEYQYPQGGTWAEVDLFNAVAQLRRCRSTYYSEMQVMVDEAYRTAKEHTSFEKSKASMITALKQRKV